MSDTIAAIGGTLKYGAAYLQSEFFGKKVDPGSVSGPEAIATFIAAPVVTLAMLLPIGCEGTETGGEEDAGPDGSADAAADTPTYEDITPFVSMSTPVFYTFSDLGYRVLENGEIMTGETGTPTAPLRFAFSGGAGKNIGITMETDPWLMFSAQYSLSEGIDAPEGVTDQIMELDGLFDVTRSSERNPLEQQLNIGTTDQPSYIPDPNVAANRIPIYMGKVSFHDRTGKADDATVEYCSAARLADNDCEQYRIGTLGLRSSYNFSFPVPPEAYADGKGDFEVTLTPRIDPARRLTGHSYNMQAWIWLGAEK